MTTLKMAARETSSKHMHMKGAYHIQALKTFFSHKSFLILHLMFCVCNI